MLFLENTLQALFIFNGLRSHHCQRALLGYHYPLRTRVDRTFAWEDKFKRLLRFEHIQQRHFGMKLLAYTLIKVREFCGA
jgi:hypothetical protein